MSGKTTMLIKLGLGHYTFLTSLCQFEKCVHYQAGRVNRATLWEM